MLCLSSVVGLFPDISVSPRKCWHQPLYRSTKQEPRARGQWLTLTVHRLYSLFRRLCNCCTNSNESILVTSRCTGGECHFPFLSRAGGTRGAVPGKRPGREQQQWDVLGPCSQGHSLLPWRHSTAHSPTTLLPSGRERGTTPERALQFQSFILIVQLIRPFPRGTIQARLSFQVHLSGSFSTWETPRSKIIP